MHPRLKTIYNKVLRMTIVPVLLIVITPIVSVLIPFIIVERNGNLMKIITNESICQLMKSAWQSIKWLDYECWAIIFALLSWGLITLLVLPGRKYFGPPTPNNFRPTYWHNGFLYYILTMLIVVPLLWKFPVLHLYYKLPTLFAILNLVGIVFSLFLYIKALVMPDPGYFEVTMNPIFDYYYGIELYPHLGKYISLKMLINCRFGLMLWQLIVLMAWKANYELYYTEYSKGHIMNAATVSAILQTVYLAKFYYWEDGYMQTIDIATDRFGFYIAWGCISFVPSFYTLASVYFVKNNLVNNYSTIINAAILLLGLLSIIGNYWVDYQRQLVRRTDGKCTIWGAPPKLIQAKYNDDNGVQQVSILLASGFWGLARHFNYFFEMLAALAFGLPALGSSLIPYLYFIFMVILLVHRSLRDEEKCLAKYNRYWNEYKEVTPYKIIPYIF